MEKSPQNRRYSNEHQWAFREDPERVTVGITDYAQRMLGDVVYIDLPAIGSKVIAGKSVCVIESVKAASDVFSPVSGTLVAVNDTLTTRPEQINEAPYDAWIFQIFPDDPKAIETLLDAETYDALTIPTE